MMDVDFGHDVEDKRRRQATLLTAFFIKTMRRNICCLSGRVASQGVLAAPGGWCRFKLNCWSL